MVSLSIFYFECSLFTYPYPKHIYIQPSPYNRVINLGFLTNSISVGISIIISGISWYQSFGLMAGPSHQGYNMEDHDEGHTNFEMDVLKR